jgi:hypothetical protein
MYSNSWRVRILMTLGFPVIYLLVVAESIWEGMKKAARTYSSIWSDTKKIYRDVWRKSQDEHARHPGV